MNMESAIYLGISGLVMVIAAFFLGRRTGSGAARQLELEAELTIAHSEQARAEAEAERLRNELDAGRQEHDEYRLNVVDHFSGTSDLLRDLTVQYRSVYEHLTKGASTLCPEGFVGLTQGLPAPQIAEPLADLEVESDADALDAVSNTSGSDETRGASSSDDISSDPISIDPISIDPNPSDPNSIDPNPSELSAKDGALSEEERKRLDSEETLAVPANPR